MIEKNKAKALLKRLKSVAESLKGKEEQRLKRRVPLSSYNYRRTSIGCGNTERLELLEQDLNNIAELVEQFWLADKEVTQTVSRKTIEADVFDLIGQHRQNPNSLDTSSIRSLFIQLKSAQKQYWQVFRPLYGIILSADRITLGPYTIHTWDTYQAVVANHASWLADCLQDNLAHDQINGDQPSSNPLLENLDNLIISVEVEARDKTRAIELADERFYQFENVVSYMLADTKTKYAEIFNFFNLDDFHQVLLLTKDNIFFTNGPKNRDQNAIPYDLALPFFTNGVFPTEQAQYWIDSGHEWIWQALTRSDLNERQKRVLTAIEWIGRGIRDKDLSRSLVQYAFALEALFTIGKDAVTKQLAEFSAYVLESEPQKVEIRKNRITKIYDKRSAIAHGRSSVVDNSMVVEMLKLVKEIVTQLITNPELAAIETDAKMQDWLASKKVKTADITQIDQILLDLANEGVKLSSSALSQECLKAFLRLHNQVGASEALNMVKTLGVEAGK
ncbi:HEPN domain-containing protein [Stenomitos frigidus]|uniref:Uncharacterized protein n=1 Tax=Stenomitos frigidus ULC18 TaxID=2107698 RepID=A0A2T1DV51_9CYAN|nr:HEPN domain-containing protein [Stenomitos frigidus]PSB24359.1 hypothetical protein C7B82_27545 [Stenomitos frigidus ULC18]